MANAEEIGSNFANFAESHRHPLDNDIDVHNDIDVVAITRASVPPFVSFFRNGGTGMATKGYRMGFGRSRVGQMMNAFTPRTSTRAFSMAIRGQ